MHKFDKITVCMTNYDLMIPIVKDELHFVPKMSHHIIVGIDINKWKFIGSSTTTVQLSTIERYKGGRVYHTNRPQP